MSKIANKRKIKQEASDILAQESSRQKILEQLMKVLTNQDPKSIQSTLEIVFRQQLISLLKLQSEKTNSIFLDKNSPFNKMKDLILLAIALAKNKSYIRVGAVPLMIQDIFEGLPIQETATWFVFIEENITNMYISSLISDESSAAVGGAMVKAFMSLMKRLSKSSDVIFCGRILMCLSKIMPLFDKSGVNLKGKVNTGNVTSYAQQDEESSAKIGNQNLNFYKNFWKLITHIQDITLVQKSENDWNFVIETINSVLDMFGTNNEANCVLGPISVWNENTKKPVSNGYFTTKYLTSPQLMMLEITEPYFREHILIQMLIFFQNLKISCITKTEWILSENKKEVISDLEKKIKNQLSIFSTLDGRKIGNSIEHVLNREQNWIQWKKNSCVAFGKNPDNLDNVNPAQSQRPAKKIKLGNKNLEMIWELASDQTSESFKRVPTPHAFFAPVLKEIDEEPNLKICNNSLYQWKAHRLLCRYDYSSLLNLLETNSLEETAKKILSVSESSHETDSKKRKRTTSIDHTQDSHNS